MECRCAFFCYIRLWRVILVRSDIRLSPSEIRFASFVANIISLKSQGFNITLVKPKYHANKDGISLLLTPRRFYAILNSERRWEYGEADEERNYARIY